ncbi:MAG: sugar/nucleoside kinase (ribokinase family) [Pseudomonadales bacterium]|jgi:sugar/nucleoside kinase (ribokinase family)
MAPLFKIDQPIELHFMKKYQIYGIGAALVDTEIEVNDAFLEQANIEKGLMTLVDEARQQELIALLTDHMVASKRASGGSAANTVIGASYFGAKAYYSCKVANDENGDFYLQDIKDAGVDVDSGRVKPNGITGKCLVLITPDAERSMNTFLGISETFSDDELDLDALASSEYVYIEGYLVTSPTGKAAAISARKHAEANGVKTAISLSDPGMVEFFGDGLQEMVGDKVDLLFSNEDEALGWTKTDTIEDAAEKMKVSANTFAITLGSKGALVFDGQTMHTIAPHVVKAIDTNGAGDMFAGAFLYAITNGFDFAMAGKLACRSAAELVTRFGPRLPAAIHGELKAEVL